MSWFSLFTQSRFLNSSLSCLNIHVYTHCLGRGKFSIFPFVHFCTLFKKRPFILKNLCRIESSQKQSGFSVSTGNTFPKQRLIASRQSACQKIFLTLCHLPEAVLFPLPVAIIPILSLFPYHSFSVVPLLSESFNYLLSQTLP